MIEEKNIKFNGKNLFYLESRKEENSKSMVMMHGYAFSSKDWKRIGSIDHFANLGYNVYAPDYPGFGKSEENANFKIGRGNLENSESFAQSFMEFLGIGNYTLVGASMGGGMAIKNAILFPDSVSKLIVIGPAWLNKEVLDQLKTETLFVWGKDDTVVPYKEMSEQIKKYSHFEFETIENAGHPAYLDQPQKFFDLVDKFLKK